MNAAKFDAVGYGVSVIITRKEQTNGLEVPIQQAVGEVPIQHFFKELELENDEEYDVTNGVKPREIDRRLSFRQSGVVHEGRVPIFWTKLWHSCVWVWQISFCP